MVDQLRHDATLGGTNKPAKEGWEHTLQPGKIVLDNWPPNGLQTAPRSIENNVCVYIYIYMLIYIHTYMCIHRYMYICIDCIDVYIRFNLEGTLLQKGVQGSFPGVDLEVGAQLGSSHSRFPTGPKRRTSNSPQLGNIP